MSVFDGLAVKKKFKYKFFMTYLFFCNSENTGVLLTL